VDNGSVTLLCTEEQEQLYNGDCYIIRYSYIEDGKDYHLFFAWSGLNSINVRSLITSLLTHLLENFSLISTFRNHEEFVKW
jgi:hypothetical protein